MSSEWIQHNKDLGSSAARAAVAAIEETRSQIVAANLAALLLTGLVFAVAVIAPGMLTRATTDAPGKTEQPVLANVQPDHGGLVRLTADRSGHYRTEAEINNRTVSQVSTSVPHRISG